MHMPRYPLVIPIEVRFGDLDALAHVNNAVYLTYLETARLKYTARLGIDQVNPSYLLARIEVDYVRPVLLGETVDVGTRISHIGNSSFRMQHEMWVNQSTVAKAQSVLVWVENGVPTRVPAVFRQAVQAFELDPVDGL